MSSKYNPPPSHPIVYFSSVERDQDSAVEDEIVAFWFLEKVSD